MRAQHHPLKPAHRAPQRGAALLFASVAAISALAQLSVAPQSNLQQLAAAITGPGVAISNPVITCHSLGYGEYSYTGTGMAITEGVILTSGRINDAIGPNNSTGSGTWFAQNTPGDPLLDAVTGRSTRDACKFEFDIIPTGDSLRFEFTFGSEEYNEWVGSQYNDVFGFFISGPGITGDPGAGSDHNIALIPGTSTPVTINNVNNGSNSTYYDDNTGGSQTQYDGYTVDLAAEAVVQPCQSYHLKLIVADASDRKYDSGVFIEKIESPTISLSTFTQGGGPDMVEACNPGWIRFDRGDPRPTPLTLNYYLQGTATNGTDYAPIGNPDPLVAKTIIIPANQAYVDRAVDPLFDLMNEGTEYIRCILGNPNCPSVALDTVIFNIIDSVFATCTPGGSICAGGSWPFIINGGASYNWSPATGLSCTTCPDPVATPAATTLYQATVSDGNCNRIFNRLVTVSNPTLSALVTHPLCNGGSNGAINLSVANGIAPITYAWTGPSGFTASTQDITNIPAGTYTVSVTDAVCTRTQSWNVIDPPTLGVSLAAAMLPFGQNIACNGGTTGSIDGTISGGTAPYTVTWTGPNGYSNSSIDIGGLGAGTYSVSIVDAHGCSTSANTTLTESPAISFSANATANVLCFGTNIGAANSSISGGIPPYTYSWNSTPVQNSANASALAPGNYTVTLTDAYGCTASANLTIAGPTAPLSTSITAQTNVLCSGNSTGSAGISISGGTAPYTTSWNTTPAQSGTTATNLPAGTWTATVTDANGCTTTRDVTITQPASEISASLFAQVNVNCFGGNAGSATVSANGGTGPYTYQWNTTPVQNTATASNLTAGSYTCTVRDVNLCSTPVNVTITQPAAALSANINAQTNVLCFGNSTGSATVSVSGGIAPYSFIWNTSPAQTTTSAINLPAGAWTCTVTDANGCMTVTNATILQPAAALNASINAQSDVLCHGNATGNATVGVTGGTGLYAFTWNTIPVQSTATASGLGAGSYDCTITDGNGCSTTTNATITQPSSALSASISALTMVPCFGGASGSATANAVGGTAPHAYAWNTTPAQVTATASNLPAGNYSCTITDANGCTTSIGAAIPGPSSALIASIVSQSNVAVFGESTGSATASANGGDGPYTYQWSNGQSTATATALPAGNYTVVVSDANGCTAQTTVTITQPGSALIAQVIGQTNVTCHGANTGSATVDASGGTPIYSYNWNTAPAQNSPAATGLPAGTWTCTVTDANGAMTSVAVVITEPASALSASISAQQNAACSGNATGSATASAMGGTAPYGYSWNTIPVQINALASGLAAGTYTCTVTDANGCTTTVNATVTEPSSPLAASITAQSEVDCFGNSTGNAAAAASQGTAPYTYSWNTSPAQTTTIAIGLAIGSYTCTITDANGCTTSVGATITQPASGLVAGINSISQATCGVNNGGANVSAIGGTGPYSYSWDSSPVQNTAALSGVGTGTYVCAITDANGCTTTAMATITSPIGLAIAVVNTTAQTCFGTANGQATVAASGGNPPYTILWNTTPAQAGATASGLIAGSYTATVTDADGCTASVNVAIDGPASPLVLSITSVSDVLCHGQSTGAATVSATGGLAPYSVLWNTMPAQSGNTATGLSAGTWTATATDAFGCMNSITVTIDQPVAPLDGYVDAFQNVSCFGGNDGYASIEATGGSGNYSIEWNTTPVQYGATATGLTAGIWFVTIQDNNGCNMPKMFPVSIEEPLAPVALTTTTSDYNGFGISCIGAIDGSINVTATGGTLPYTFAWTGPNGFTSNSEDINGLEAGTYDLLVTDANGCSENLSITLAPPTVISATANITTATCGGANNGAIDINASGGVPPYSFAWSGPSGFSATSEDITAVPAGVYTVNITGANGCTSAFSYSVNEPDLFAVSATVSGYNGGSNVSCAASNDGAIDVTVTGGTQPYTFQWSGPGGFTANTEDISGLVAGNYDLTIVDANGCGTLEQYTLTAPATLFATLAPQTFPSGGNVSCDGASDGAIDATITGGTPGFTISWTGPNGFSANTEEISGLEPGTYTLTVLDVNGCSASQSVFLSSPSDLNVSLSVSQYNSGDAINCNGSFTGAIDLSITGGLAPYTVNWTGPNSYANTAIDITSLAAGTYTAVVSDAAGCDTTFTVTLNEPTPMVATSTVSDHNGFEVGCSGSSDGSIDLSVSGGAGFYTFQWTGSNAFVSINEDVSGLPAGTYDVVISDLNGCKTLLSFVLEAPTAISASATIVTAACQGANNGAIDLTISGGVAPYGAQWTGPGGFNANGEDLSSLFAGIYDVTIIDANGCSISASFDVNEPGLFTVSATSTVYPGGYGVSCSGASDGAIDLTASGGTSPLFFSWQGPGGFTAITEDIDGLAAGTYDLTLTDANGCSSLHSWTITSPTPITIGLAASQFPDGSNVACSGGGDGSIDATIVGGVAPYTITWAGPGGFISINEDITNLPAGDYTIDVTDAIGCSASASITLTEPAPVNIGVSTSLYISGGNVSCHGESNGSIDLTLSGGSLIYLIDWTGPNNFQSNNEDISGLPAGTYNVTVTDANACTASTSVTLIEPDPILIDLAVSQFGGGYSIGCSGTSGSVDATVQGGAVPWTYSWTGPNGFTSNAQDLNGVPAGTYFLVVTDAAGCTASADVTLIEPVPVDMTATVSSAGNGFEVGCAGNDGSIALDVSGGVAPYIFDWSGSNGFASLNEDLTDLPAGTYDVSITDVNGCISNASFTLEQAADLTATVTVSGNVCDGLDDGAIDLSVNGGVPSLTYAWTGPDGFTSADEDINGLVAGTYAVAITDANGCTAQQSATIAASAPIDLSVYVSDYGDVNIPCAGAATGVIEATLSGGAGSLNIAWTGPNGFTSTAAFLSGLEAGDYTLSVTDVNGCPLDTTITLIAPAGPIDTDFTAAVQQSGTNVSCFGGSDGSIDLTVTGGTAPYDVTWHGPGGSSYSMEDPTGLVAGPYYVVIIDAHGCSFSDSTILIGPDSALMADITLSQFVGGFNTSCDGSSDGSISVSAHGGSGTYQFNWSGPNGFTSTADSIGNLTEGIYTLAVTDLNGCVSQQDINLIAPEPITWEFDVSSFASGTNISCNGLNNGSIFTTVNGGSGTYSALWTGPDGFSTNDPDITGLTAGEYCVTITDANGCSVSDCITLSQPEVLLLEATTTQAACGQANGAIDATVTGGSTPYTYAWSNGADDEDISGLVADTYSLVTTDANGCTASISIQLVGAPALLVEATVIDVPCHGGNEGVIDLTVISGTAPYTFDWTGTNSGEDLVGATAGGYQVIVTDANGCSWSEVLNISEPPALQVDSTVSTYADGHEVSAFGAADGSISVVVSGGSQPYTYAWSNGSNNDGIDGLTAGTYSVTITDANGCMLQLAFTLTQPTTLEMPTGFTPNDDGKNDAFVIHGLEGYHSNQLVVFNRWGNVVFDQLNYKNDWRGENQQGQPLPNGTYFVILRLNDGALTLQNYVDLRR